MASGRPQLPSMRRRKRIGRRGRVLALLRNGHHTFRSSVLWFANTKTRIQQPFTNKARIDGLVLKHWRRKHAPQATIGNGEDTAMEDAENSDAYIESNGEFLKYNVEPEMPTFTDEEYDMHLRSSDWSREETDYLFQLVKDYSYRWAVIWDRYDYQPSANSSLAVQDPSTNGDTSQALAALPFAHSKARNIEDLKARFYEISAKLMKLHIPEVQMDADQYAKYEMLTKFDPMLERNRKTLASALMNRNMDEVKEEEFLLAELQRINMAANRLDAEREELRARLEAPMPNQQMAAGLTAFTSSQALLALFQQLFQQDRSKKRQSGGAPGRLSLAGSDILATPTSAQHAQMAANRRQSMATQPPPTPIRNLNPQEEMRYNVSTHDRLTSGVTFGSDKLLKMRQAKSNVQTQKIAAALQELGISDLIAIPTTRVADVFEGLIGKVGKLLDVRKVREKEEGECRVLEAMKEKVNGGGGGADDAPADGPRDGDALMKDEIRDSFEEDDAAGEEDADAEGEDDDGDMDAEGEEDDVDAEGEEDSRAQSVRQPSESVSTRAASAGHKRSASVLSQASTKSSKRLRK
jgi:DNA methyltransferase 1-associated protein 1